MKTIDLFPKFGSFVAHAVSPLFFSMGVGAFAASNLQPIQAFLNTSLKIQVNGQNFTPSSAPITYNSTTYLPLRSVADALDVPVRYDAGKDYQEAYYNDGDGDREGSFMLHPKKKYATLVLQAAALDEDIAKFVVLDSDTRKELKSTKIARGEGLKTITVKISGSDALYVYAELKDGGKLFVPLTASYYK